MLSLIQKKFDKILPTNKIEQMCMERLFGIAFQQEGLDVSNSIQGENFNTKFIWHVRMINFKSSS